MTIRQEKVSFIPIPKKVNAKECPNYCTIALISHASKVMLKILQARLQQYVNRELSDVQTGFRKGRGTRDQIASTRWIMEKAREFQKNIYFCFIDYAKALDYVDHNKLWKILKDDAVKVLHSICQQIWKTQQWPQDWKRAVFIPISKKSNDKEFSNYHVIALISHANKIMLKILQARFQQYIN